MSISRSTISSFGLTAAAALLIAGNAMVSPAYGQGRSTIGGIVMGPDRRPVDSVPVELRNDNESVIQRTKTDGSGRYLFRGVPSGRFSVKVLPLGTNLEEMSLEAEIAGLSADGRRQLMDNVQLDFNLRRRRNPLDILQIKGVVFAQDIPNEARKLYEKATSNLNANKVDEGIAGLESAIRIFPTYYLALARLGLAYVDVHRFKEAKDVFTQAVTINQRSFAGWSGLSFANYYLNDPQSAIEAARKALEVDGTSVTTLFVLGMSQRQLKDYEDAEKSLLQAKKLDGGKTADIDWYLALLYAHNLNRYNDAANELEAYLTINPNPPNKDDIKKLIRHYRETPSPSPK